MRRSILALLVLAGVGAATLVERPQPAEAFCPTFPACPITTLPLGYLISYALPPGCDPFLNPNQGNGGAPPLSVCFSRFRPVPTAPPARPCTPGGIGGNGASVVVRTLCGIVIIDPIPVPPPGGGSDLP